MVSRISGTLVGLEGIAAAVEPPGGLVYEVLLPAYIAATLAEKIGTPVSFATLEYLESEGQGSSYIPRLIGFPRPQDRKFFELFTTVKGIGNKKALRALAIEPAQVARAIMAKDSKALQQLPEIGKRMAETVIAELHGKVDAFLGTSEIAGLNSASELKPLPTGGPAEEAVSALMALGETPANAQRKVALVLDAARGKSLSTDEIVSAVFGGG